MDFNDANLPRFQKKHSRQGSQLDRGDDRTIAMHERRALSHAPH